MNSKQEEQILPVNESSKLNKSGQVVMFKVPKEKTPMLQLHQV